MASTGLTNPDTLKLTSWLTRTPGLSQPSPETRNYRMTHRKPSVASRSGETSPLRLQCSLDSCRTGTGVTGKAPAIPSESQSSGLTPNIHKRHLRRTSADTLKFFSFHISNLGLLMAVSLTIEDSQKMGFEPATMGTAV